MPEIQIGVFSVTITAAGIDGASCLVVRTSGASVVAGPGNVALSLTLKDEYGNLVSGTYGVKVKAGDWFNEVAIVFTNGVAGITFGVTVASAYIDVPVAVVVPI